jgi:hypothetical protein
MGGVPEILTDIIAKNILLLPVLGKSMARFIQYLCKMLLKLSAVKKLSSKTSKNFPLGYFMIAEKLS